MKTKENVLIEKSKKGDISAFEELIETYQNKVFNIAYSMLNNYEDANDVAQEVFIRVYKSIKNFKGESSFSTWLYRITTNVCLDELRKRKNKNVVSIDEDIPFDDGEVTRQIVDDGPTPDIIAEKKEVREIVNEAIGQLSEEHKTVIILRELQGLSYEEISKIINCPRGTVKSRINRARSALKNILKSKKELFNKDYVK
ncbi:MAG TPA: sigma-70 family RNA polymerase sigma factor [Clostridiaceae bacterium]|nr:sigma-70 family RNA polymerase sigma factor [Clostridiaceae bacterium]